MKRQKGEGRRMKGELRRKRQENLGRLLRPRHIAFVGGSQALGALAACQQANFDGQLWLVNPRRAAAGDVIEGVLCVADVKELPEPPDAALLALSPERTVTAVKALSQMGAGGAVCMAAGFAELDNNGKRLQAELIEAAGELAVVGPNCMGVLNQFDGTAVWGSGTHMANVASPGAAIISQSGALLIGMTNVEQVFPLGYAISIGNQAVIEAADCIQAVLDDERVHAIGLYLEGIEDGNALAEACQRAFTRGVPIVVLKGGDTPAGETVAIGHTGAMVVERDLWNAFASRYGLVEVSSPKALVETLKLLTISGVPAGRRLTVVTFSGGLNSLTAARAPKMGLELLPPTEENGRKLLARMPAGVPIANPLDLNVPWKSRTGLSLEDGEAVAEGLVELAEDVADMMIFFVDIPRPDEKRLDADWLPTVEGVGHVRETLGIPCMVSGIMPEGLDIGLRQRLLAMGVAPLLGFSDGLEACAVAGQVAEVRKMKSEEAASPPLWSSRQDVTTKRKMLDEAASKALLRPFGLQMPEMWTGKPEDAAEAASELGFPVVLKVISETIAHKAKAGGVRLGLDSVEAVETAVIEMKEAVANAPNGHIVEQVLIEKMVSQPVAEFIIGLKAHPALGWALMIGRGGTAVEQLNQYKTILLPLVDSELEMALNQLGLCEGVAGYAGMKTAVAAVASFAEANQTSLRALDVNPIIVTAGGDVIAVDALVVR